MAVTDHSQASAPLDFPDHMPLPPADKVECLDYRDPLDPEFLPLPRELSRIPVSGYRFFRQG